MRCLGSVCFALCVSTTASAEPTDSAKLMVLVQPMGSHTAVVMTFSEVVPHAEARARLARLAELTGAHIVSSDITDITVATPAGSSRASARQTGLEALLSGMQYSAQRAFILQPFLAAFGDLGRFDVLFLTQRVDGFAGLRYWDGEGISVRLLQDGAPYRYRFVVSSDVSPALTLPVYHPVAPKMPDPARSSDHSKLPGPWLFGAALLSGCAVFILLLARARLRAAGRSGQFTAGKGEVRDHA